MYFEQKIVWNSISNGTCEIKTRFQLHQFSIKKNTNKYIHEKKQLIKLQRQTWKKKQISRSKCFLQLGLVLTIKIKWLSMVVDEVGDPHVSDEVADIMSCREIATVENLQNKSSWRVIRTLRSSS